MVALEDGFDDIRCQQAELNIAGDMGFGEVEVLGQGFLGGDFAGEKFAVPDMAEGNGFDNFCTI